MLTINKFEKIKEKEIFASGVDLIKHPWYNKGEGIRGDGVIDENGMAKCKWIAIKKGGSWFILHSCSRHASAIVASSVAARETSARHGRLTRR